MNETLRAFLTFITLFAFAACAPYSGSGEPSEDGDASPVSSPNETVSEDGGVHNDASSILSYDSGTTDASTDALAPCDASSVHQAAIWSSDQQSKYSWTDCVSLDTFNVDQAMKACAAIGATGCAVDTVLPASCGHPDGGFVSGQAPSTISGGMATWGWSWSSPAGSVWESVNGSCYSYGSWN